MLNDILFEKQNGGMGRTAPNADPVSGLLMALGTGIAATLAQFERIGEGGAQVAVIKLKYFEQLANQFGIAESLPKDLPEGAELSEVQKQHNAIVQHVREFFRMSPAGTLYLAIKAGGEISGEHIKALQYFAGGEIRQVGVFSAAIAVADYQSAADELSGEHQALSVIATPAKGASTLADYYDEDLSQVAKNRANVSILISRDLDPALDEKLGAWAQYGCIGTVLGAVSAAAVHESIAWVAKFPLSLKIPGFITGEAVKTVSTATLNLINDLRYLFVRTHTGDAGNYLNDSHTLDEATSDYAFIENTRTMDKAIRGIRSNLLPYLNAPLYVNPESGKLSFGTVANLELIASKALEDMEKAGELSGYRAVIDPEQNVLATSEVEVQIKNVPVGVMRTVRVKIGYTTKV
ncbi:MAG: DUF2586 domain-containing protein [Bacteroidales bacterium]|jgi:hypothetical protein|nr:DUF2586 domain-containing protein [Bacteroidales bacterium]